MSVITLKYILKDMMVITFERLKFITVRFLLSDVGRLFSSVQIGLILDVGLDCSVLVGQFTQINVSKN